MLIHALCPHAFPPSPDCVLFFLSDPHRGPLLHAATVYKRREQRSVLCCSALPHSLTLLSLSLCMWHIMAIPYCLL